MNKIIRNKINKKWHSIKQRCYDKKHKTYKYYGGKGIKVCDEWLNDFENFYNWSIKNGYKIGLTIDRIDNNKDYSPQNCRYVDKYKQANNTSRNVYIDYKGEKITLAELAKKYNITYTVLFSRIYYQKMDLEEALNIPQNRIYKNKVQRRGAEKPIIQYTKKGIEIKRFISLIQAEYQTGISRKNISKVLRKTNKTAGGFIWKYEVKE